MKNRMCDMFGIEVPIFAFSHCRDVVAAVSNAGGLGVLGALYFTPDELELELRWLDEHCNGKPYGVDIVMPMSSAAKQMEAADIDPSNLEGELEKMIPKEHRDFVERILEEHDVPPLPADAPHARKLIGWTDSGARGHVEVSFDHPIALMVNALGPMAKDIVEMCHEKGVKTAALVGRTDQALHQIEQGVDIIVAQGHEAGGHTGDVGSIVLWPEVVDAVAPHPVLAAGGIGTGRQVAAALALGCDGVWTGSIWLTTAEADTQPAWMELLLKAGTRDTVRSRALTGKPARQLRTGWTEAWDDPKNPDPLPMPLQFLLQAEARQRIGRAGKTELEVVPVGEIVGRMDRVRPVKDVMYELVDGLIDAGQHLNDSLSE
jgi:NAD(P)H-dependent flavin oxidoreductase YrpB (nitropropane dioxygenase family)